MAMSRQGYFMEPTVPNQASGPISMTFFNFTPWPWSRGPWGGTVVYPWDSFVVSPSDVLKVNGSESLVVDETALSQLAKGTGFIHCVWSCEEFHVRFGIQIIVHAQVLGMGYRPEWQFFIDNGATNDGFHFKSPDGDVSEVHEFEHQVTHGPKQVSYLHFRVTPKSGHSSLSLNCNISYRK
jgi:hypothetical protein